MSKTEELAANLVETSYDSIPGESTDRAKWRVIDAVGCAMAGAAAAGCSAVVDLVRKWGGAPEGTVWTRAFKAPAPNATMANAVMTRSFDFEPIEAEGENRSGPAHISGTTIPTALTMAEYRGASGQDLLCALILGDDLTSRIGIASGLDLGLGWDNTGTMNVFGATAIASRLLGLDTRQTTDAFGIALNQMGGSMDGVWDKAMTFKLNMAVAARNGIVSAELAAHGFTGTKDAFFGRYGFFALYCRDPDVSVLTKDLGKRFYADRVIKPYSSCRATHSSIDCALEIAARDIRPEEIDRVVVHLHPLLSDGFVGGPFGLGETPQIDGAFSVRYTVATALLHGEVRPEHFSDECARDPRIRALIDRIDLVANEPASMTTILDVRLSNGTVLTASTGTARGDVYDTPLTPDEIRRKFRDNVRYSRTVSLDRAESVLALLEDLEHVADVRDITRLLA